MFLYVLLASYIIFFAMSIDILLGNCYDFPMKKDDVLMTRLEVMEYLKISHNLMYSLMRDRAFPFFRLKGRKVLFKKSDIDKWLESKRVK